MKEIYENIFDKYLIRKHGERNITEEERQHDNKTINYTLLSVLGYLIDQRGLDRDTIILVFYNIKTIVFSMLGWNR